MSYLHWSSSNGRVGGYSQDKFFVSFDISLAPLDPNERCQFFYDALFVPGPPSLLVVIARLVFADNLLFPYDKEWLIEYAGLFYRDLTWHEMEVNL